MYVSYWDTFYLFFFIMDWSFVFMILGFTLAMYSVVANDSVQTLWTFIASNKKIKWYWLALGASAIAVATVCYSWFANSWDISWWRLMAKWIEFPEIFTVAYVIVPLVLLLLTRFWIPVSTTFLILSIFSSKSAIESMLIKSLLGYIVAFIAAYAFWHILSKFLDELKSPSITKVNWRILQIISTWYLRSVWLMHDMANISVFLPRNMNIWYLVFTIVLMTGFLFYIFWRKWGTIQHIVTSKTWTRFIRSATIIDFVYATVLFVFKEMSNVPMSTTWVFVWLLAWRELAIIYQLRDIKQLKLVFPIIAKDFGKILFWLVVSVLIAIAFSFVNTL